MSEKTTGQTRKILVTDGRGRETYVEELPLYDGELLQEVAKEIKFTLKTGERERIAPLQAAIDRVNTELLVAPAEKAKQARANLIAALRKSFMEGSDVDLLVPSFNDLLERYKAHADGLKEARALICMDAEKACAPIIERFCVEAEFYVQMLDGSMMNNFRRFLDLTPNNVVAKRIRHQLEQLKKRPEVSIYAHMSPRYILRDIVRGF